jgi:hypothetical protein
MSDQLVTQFGNCTTHNQHNIRTSIRFVGTETAITAVERPQTYAFDHKAAGIANRNVIQGTKQLQKLRFHKYR